MRVALVSFHFRNTTAEGIATGRVAAALANAGHRVVVFTSGSNPHDVEPSENLVVEAVHGDEANAPGWWQSMARRAKAGGAWDKLVAVPNLAYGCNVAEWGWVRQVTRRVLDVSRAGGPFDVLHSRLNPHTSHLAAREVTRAVPASAWCAYFSDPWPYSLYPEPYRFTVGPVARVRLEAVLDSLVDRADSLVFPAERLKHHLLGGRRRHALGKAFVAPHLSRPAAAVAPRKAHAHLLIRHGGFLMKERRIEPLYGALRRLMQIHPDVTRTLRIEFAGRYVGAAVPLPPPDLADVVRFLPYMNTEAVWDWLEDADALLLVEAKMREGIFFPSKLAEYLGAGRPILALSPLHGVATDLLGGSGTLLVEPDDEAGIAAALSRLLDDWRDGTLPGRTPSEAQRRLVSAEAVVPIYEQAFAAAIDRAKASRR